MNPGPYAATAPRDLAISTHHAVRGERWRDAVIAAARRFIEADRALLAADEAEDDERIEQAQAERDEAHADLAALFS